MDKLTKYLHNLMYKFFDCITRIWKKMNANNSKLLKIRYGENTFAPFKEHVAKTLLF